MSFSRSLKLLPFAAAAFSLAACGSNASGPVSECANIQAAFASIADTPPMSSLPQADEEGKGGIEILGVTCQQAEMGAFSAGDPTVHLLTCPLFSAGVFDQEENAAKADKIFEDAKAKVAQCLPEGWTVRESESNSGRDVDEQLIYERPEDMERKNSGEMYMYPAYLAQKFDSNPPGRFSRAGWSVELKFQFEGAVEEE